MLKCKVEWRPGNETTIYVQLLKKWCNVFWTVLLGHSLCSSEQLGKMNVASGGVAENKGPNEIDSANSKRSSSWISTGERQKDGLEPPFFALVSYQHPALSQRRLSATKHQIPCTSGPVSVIKQYSKILATFKKFYNTISKPCGAVFKKFCNILQHNQ